MSARSRHRKQLEDRLVELTGRVSSIESELGQPLTGDLDDDSIEMENDEVLETMGQSDEGEIRRIESALERMDAGTYGICVKCDATISEKRLDLLPATPFCRKCAA